MKTRIVLILSFAMLAGFQTPLAMAQEKQTATLNEARQTRFAERVIAIELVRALSADVRTAREKCLTACPETGALELAIGLMGIGQGKASAETLVNLLGLRLDGAGSEELSCQILIRGRSVSRPLEQLQSRQIAEHCQSLFSELRKRELAGVSDVKVEQVCRSEAEVRRVQDTFLKAVKSKTLCEQ